MLHESKKLQAKIEKNLSFWSASETSLTEPVSHVHLTIVHLTFQLKLWKFKVFFSCNCCKFKELPRNKYGFYLKIICVEFSVQRIKMRFFTIWSYPWCQILFLLCPALLAPLFHFKLFSLGTVRNVKKQLNTFFAMQMLAAVTAAHTAGGDWLVFVPWHCTVTPTTLHFSCKIKISGNQWWGQ